MSLHVVKFGVWCAISAATIFAPIFKTSMLQTLRLLFHCLYDYDIMYTFAARYCNGKRFYTLFIDCFWWRMIRRFLWPSCSLDLKRWNYFLCSILEKKALSSNIYRLENNLRKRVQDRALSVSPQEIGRVAWFRSDESLRCKGNYSQNYVYTC